MFDILFIHFCCNFGYDHIEGQSNHEYSLYTNHELYQIIDWLDFKWFLELESGDQVRDEKSIRNLERETIR